MAIDIEDKATINNRTKKRPHTQMFSIYYILFLIICAGILFSGGTSNITIFPKPGLWYNPNVKQNIMFQNQPAQNALQMQTFDMKVDPASCKQQAVMTFLVETSAAMEADNRLAKVRQALLDFSSGLQDSAGIGIYRFDQEAGEVTPPSFYSVVKTDLPTNINSMTGAGAWAATRAGILEVRNSLDSIILRKLFPQYYRYAVILVTGTVPSSAPDRSPQSCVFKIPGANPECFSTYEDPRTSPSLVTQLKTLHQELNADIQLFTVDVTSGGNSASGSATTASNPMQPYLDGFLKNIASTPKSTHYYTSNGDDLKNTFEKIAAATCSTPPGTGNAPAAEEPTGKPGTDNPPPPKPVVIP